MYDGTKTKPTRKLYLKITFSVAVRQKYTDLAKSAVNNVENHCKISSGVYIENVDSATSE